MSVGSKFRFLEAIHAHPVDRAPIAPKIWLDWVAEHGFIPLDEALSNPFAAMLSVVQASRDMGFDAARLFLMPPRHIKVDAGEIYQMSATGMSIGRIDINGGWATQLNGSADFNIENPEITMNIQSYTARTKPVREKSDAKRIAVPFADWYENWGYGEAVDDAIQMAGDCLCPLGDCNSGTLSFYIALRGMNNAMTDLFDNPDMVHVCMEKGVEISLERAKFFLKHGVSVLRYNDSSANMMLISPNSWRTFIFPHLKRFCDEVHKLNADAVIYCHMCGNILPVMRDILVAGIDCIGPLDPLSGFSVADFRNEAGYGVSLMGGVNTLTLLNADAETVEREARACIRGGGQGFTLGSGCAVPRYTPRENLKALVRASIAEA